MEDKILLGRNSQMQEIPTVMWRQHLTAIPQHGQTRLSFMTDLHHQIRYFVVRELVNRQTPVEVEIISEALHIAPDKVNEILEELERKLFFLVRNKQGAVAWAYPITVEATPHRLEFNSGEKLYAA